LNVVRNAAGEWNLESFGRREGPLADALASGASEEESIHTVLPRIRIESGRVNFKAENYKKAYTVNSLDLELLPPEAPHQPWAFRFEGTPNRTDLPLRPASRWEGEGEFGPFTSSIQEETGIPLRLDWRAEDALLADLLGVLTGKDFGVHGTITLQGRLAGTTSLLRLTAKAELRDAHRWDLMPSHDAPMIPAEIAGIVDLDANSLELASLSIPAGDGSLVLRGRVEDLFDHPRLETDAELRRVPLAAVVEVARRFTTRLDARLAAQGTLDGRVGMNGSLEGLSAEDLSASVEVTGAILQDTESSQVVRFSKFPVLLKGRTGALGPLDANLEQASLRQANLRKAGLKQEGPVHLSARWDLATPSSELHLRGDTIPLSSLLHWAQALGAGWGQADVERLNAEQGDVALRLDVTRRAGEFPRIAGWAEISGAVFHTARANRPVRIPEARLAFRKDLVQVQPLSAALGAMELQGSLVAKWAPAKSDASGLWRPVSSVEFDLTTPNVDVGELASLFGMKPEPRTFAWFRGDEQQVSAFPNLPPVRGALNAASIRYRGFEWRNVTASLQWHDRQLEIADFAGEFAGGTQRGTATVFFQPGPPAFTLETRYSNLDLETLTEGAPAWRDFFSGRLSGELRLSGRGNRWDEIVRQLSGSGQASGREIALRGLDLTGASEETSGVETRFASFSTEFQIAKDHVRINELKAAPEQSSDAAGAGAFRPVSWRISGTVGFDRGLDLLVQQEPEGGAWRWAGTLSEPRVTQSSTPATPAGTDASLRAQ
jgi:hypothetical protein